MVTCKVPVSKNVHIKGKLNIGPFPKENDVAKDTGTARNHLVDWFKSLLQRPKVHQVYSLWVLQNNNNLPVPYVRTKPPPLVPTRFSQFSILTIFLLTLCLNRS